MNLCIFMGRLTRDPEISYSAEDQIPIARFSIAVDRIRKGKNGESTADFFQCTAFQGQAEFIEKYFRKGKRILVCGRMENNSYTAKDGSKVYGDTLLVDRVEFADGKEETGDGNAAQEYPVAAPPPGGRAAEGRTAQRGGSRASAKTQAGARRTPARSAAAPTGDSFMDVPSEEEGLPFN